jgi:VWFA-related protein
MSRFQLSDVRYRVLGTRFQGFSNLKLETWNLKLRLFIAIVIAFTYASLVMAGSVGAQEAANFKVNRIEASSWPDLTINMTLTGPDGKAVADVNASQFQVFEQGKEQAVAGIELGPAHNVPLAIVLVIDVSGSMNADNKLNQAKAAANVFLNSVRPEDSAAIVAFSDKPTIVVKPTNDRGALQAGVNALQANGETAIYDGLQLAAKTFNTAKKGQRRAIILLTDGADTSSKSNAEVAAKAAKATGAFVYTIGLGPDVNGSVLTR